MKKLTIVAASLALTGAFASHAAQAADPASMARNNGCMGCHQVDKKMVGPAYKDVAAKYDSGDKAMLVEKVLNGGSGNWGQVPMPPHKGRVSKEDVAAMVDWILSMK